MAESPSETSSELEELREYSKELLEMLRWNIGIVTVLLQEQGGAVEIPQDVLETIDINKARTVVTFDEERKVYVVEGVFADEV